MLLIGQLCPCQIAVEEARGIGKSGEVGQELISSNSRRESAGPAKRCDATFNLNSVNALPEHVNDEDEVEYEVSCLGNITPRPLQRDCRGRVHTSAGRIDKNA